MNSIPFALHWHLHSLFRWFDDEPELRVAVVTGSGPKSFCAGQDLIELGESSSWFLSCLMDGTCGVRLGLCMRAWGVEWKLAKSPGEGTKQFKGNGGRFEKGLCRSGRHSLYSQTT